MSKTVQQSIYGGFYTMKKIAKYVIGALAFLLFFLLLDDSGVGFKGHMKRIKDWANK